MRDVQLPTYTVRIARGVLDRVGSVVRALGEAHRYVLITDHQVEALYAERVAASLGAGRTLVLSVTPGEDAKTREQWATLTDRMLAARCGRDTVVVTLGGGTIGDLGGFVAATYMRGLPLVHAPTTLLAMVDASVGGKTGVNTPAGKNLVGAFHMPAAVLVDPLTLATLPERDLRAGSAEILKHGVVADESYFSRALETLPTLLNAPSDARWIDIIARSVEIKAEVVAEDPLETGRRRVLNFGHTIAHALESASQHELVHGEAVAIGLVAESRIAERLGVAEPGTATRIEGAVRGAGLPTERPPAIEAARSIDHVRADKKARGGQIEMALPEAIGRMASAGGRWTIPVPDDLLLEALRCE